MNTELEKMDLANTHSTVTDLLDAAATAASAEDYQVCASLVTAANHIALRFCF